VNPQYSALASNRVRTRWAPYKQPEDFGYDFRTWVSPYTKGANCIGGIAIVLQDWASADGLKGGPDPDVQRYGRTRTLLTNRRLEAALLGATRHKISQTYVTNAFPFIKPGGMSSGLRLSHLIKTVREFTLPELELVQPRILIVLGAQTTLAFERCGVDAISLPHPAARGMSSDDYVGVWREKVGGKV